MSAMGKAPARVLADGGPISANEQEARRAGLEDAVHSSEMEGLPVTAEYRADAERYVAGEFDLDELGRRTRARYGLA